MKTTEDIREAYTGGWHPASVVGKNALKEFDEWLAAHDAQVYREGYDDAIATMRSEWP